MGLYTQGITDLGEAQVIGTVSNPSMKFTDYAMSVVPQEHYLVEQGILFGASTGAIQGAAIGSLFDCIFVAAAGVSDVHIKVSSNAGFEFKVFDTPTITSSGTAQSLINFNRTIGGTGAATFYVGAALATTGTQLWDEYVPAAEVKGGASVFEAAAEWVLVAGTVYGFRVNPKAVGTINLSLTMYQEA